MLLKKLEVREDRREGEKLSFVIFHTDAKKYWYWRYYDRDLAAEIAAKLESDWEEYKRLDEEGTDLIVNFTNDVANTIHPVGSR
jgi:hypothetical protein